MNDVMEKIKKELKEKVQDPVEALKEELKEKVQNPAEAFIEELTEKIQDPVEAIKEQLEGKVPDLDEIKDTEGVEELQNETLDKVSGAGNPFKNIPRVPTIQIDSELREKV